MNSSKIIEMFKDGNIVVPMYLLKNYKKMNLTLNEFVFLIYLYNHGNRFLFDPNSFANDLAIDLNEVMEQVSSLTDKGFLTVEVRKNEKGIMEEVVLLDSFYDKLKLFMMDEVSQEKSKEIEDSSIYEVIEKEFGRTLSSMEYEIIKTWLDYHFSEDIIKEALKEAVMNGVSNLRYIDKILFEWDKKGIKTVKDVEDNRKKRQSAMKKNKEENSEVDLKSLDWNWFDEEE